jgi:signal transduction histidine kinase
MRRLWPSSLYGQILLVAALALLLAQGVNTAMLIAGAQERATVEAASMLVGRVSNQIERQRLSDNDVSERNQRRRPPSIAVQVVDRPANPSGFRTQPELAERASDYLLAVDPAITSIRLSKGPLAALPPELREGPIRRWRDGPDARDRRRDPDEALLLTMKMADGSWVNAVVPIRNFRPQSAIIVLLQTLILYLAVLIPLALVARRIVRPLRALTERVGNVGLTTASSPMVADGPSDVRELIDAFNQADTRLSSLLTEKDVMLGAIGHDLKTPLAALRVRIENVEDDAERDKMAATVDEMVTILDDILMLARVGKSAEDVQKTDIGALIDTVVSEFPDDAKITIDKASERYVAPVRPVLIRRALRNLVGNALQYAGNADVRMERKGGTIQLIVDDDGPGIPVDQLDRIFEPFARVESSRNRALGGSGLGLTIARAIAHAHHGSITLQNRATGGVRAILSLPVQ